MRLAMALVTLGVGVMGCQQPPTESECERLLRHILHLTAESQPSAARGGEVLEIPEKTREYCLHSLPRQQLECGLSATTLDEVHACDHWTEPAN